ncbi:hypothetical protein PC129_g13504 [Phytophthora cactorum]|uniref:Tyr recombinase domain-containing protein n=1 Tax=Phytophthora cactorum TaxID=29920 RepID=A0A329RNE7_9STRA|nr:hypothetical protein Pcac1_g9673 [Phytophthora cactorum]KAG2836434.1 hypothetical protein PC112_g5298 [Phytophthora cactorum]KAG2841036.1 hypothetical protein PC111_g3253 [Phytophthora cactorum]KAG2863995.1 hypothetical protein PC113_g4985 [Phytophthora cactorum]KAG2911057.1 hypothetical protein PC114_g9542 [Phytophthora cactorum]
MPEELPGSCVSRIRCAATETQRGHTPAIAVVATMLYKSKRNAFNGRDDEGPTSSSKVLWKNPNNISTHSLRTGGTAALRAGGVDADTIRMHGRWSSDAYRVYVREAPASVLQLAKRMGSASSNQNRPNIQPGAAREQALMQSSR